jgi:hypothetical protein
MYEGGWWPLKSFETKGSSKRLPLRSFLKAGSIDKRMVAVWIK